MEVQFSKAALTAFLVGTGFLAVPAAWSGSAPAPSPTQGQGLFTRQVIGTWMAVGPGFGKTISIEADGTLTWFGTWFFGGGSGGNFNAPVYGKWKQTGPQEITTVEAGYLFDATNAWNATGRVVEVFTFSQDFESFTFSGTEDLFAPDQDPTDPDAVPFNSFNFSGGPVNRLGFQ